MYKVNRTLKKVKQYILLIKPQFMLILHSLIKPKVILRLIYNPISFHK